MCACGIDIGTCFLVSAKQDDNRQIQLKSIRDCFLELNNEEQIKGMLRISKMDYIEEGDKIYIIGEPALVLANIFNREARRPMARGVLSPGEFQAEKVLSVLIEAVLGKSQSAGNDVCFYSIPAASIDADMDVIYHSAMISKIISQLGYKPVVSLNEAAAIAYSNAAAENFSALTLSFGSGMVNACLMYQTMLGMTFSISRGGDYLDNSAARSVGSTDSRLQSIKERGLDLMDPSKGDSKTIREREALIIYYKSLILYALNSIKNEFIKKGKTINLPAPVPIILSGGTALAGNFLEFFKQGLATIKDWPVPYSEIRMANDPLNAPAQGLLVAALNYSEVQHNK